MSTPGPVEGSGLSITRTASANHKSQLIFRAESRRVAGVFLTRQEWQDSERLGDVIPNATFKVCGSVQLRQVTLTSELQSDSNHQSTQYRVVVGWKMSVWNETSGKLVAVDLGFEPPIHPPGHRGTSAVLQLIGTLYGV